MSDTTFQQGTIAVNGQTYALQGINITPETRMLAIPGQTEEVARDLLIALKAVLKRDDIIVCGVDLQRAHELPLSDIVRFRDYLTQIIEAADARAARNS